MKIKNNILLENVYCDLYKLIQNVIYIINSERKRYFSLYGTYIIIINNS